VDRSIFLGGPRPKVERVEVDGQVLYLRAMSAGEQMAFQGADAPPSEFVVRLLVSALVDEQGNRILAEEDAPAILDMDAQYVAKVAEEVIRVNRFDAKDRAELEKK
jgi:hypothetical protein